MADQQLEVQIMGQSYLLGCPEGGESRLLEAVEKVDTAMCKIRDAGKVTRARPHCGAGRTEPGL
jgi:cell division protein ZapA